MADTVLDVLLYLFETYTEQDQEADQVVLREELLQAGFGEPEIDSALDWLEGLGQDDTDSFDGAPGQYSTRVFNQHELTRLDRECRGYLLYLEQIGILSPMQRELVIDRLMALDAPGPIDVEQVKWVVLMVLFSQPGQEGAFSRMEDLIFGESSGAVN